MIIQDNSFIIPEGKFVLQKIEVNTGILLMPDGSSFIEEESPFLHFESFKDVKRHIEGEAKENRHFFIYDHNKEVVFEWF